MRKYSVLLMLAAVCAAQTRIDLRSQTKLPDFSGMSATRPVQTGTLLPPLCGAGELFFLTSAPAGRNLYGCAATNAWTLMSGTFAECTFDGQDIACPGGLMTGDGSAAGQLRVYERTVNGDAYIGVGAPDEVSSTYLLLLPASPPSGGQALRFGAPNGGVAASEWAQMATKVRHSTFHPAASVSAGGSWVPSPGWIVPSDGSGAQANGVSGLSLGYGYLVFGAGVTRTAVLHTLLPDNWDRGSISVKLVWSSPSGLLGQTVVFDVAASCINDGQPLAIPAVNAAQRSTVALPHDGDANLRRITTVVPSLVTTGCSPGSTLLLQVHRVASGSLPADIRLLGLELVLNRMLE